MGDWRHDGRMPVIIMVHLFRVILPRWETALLPWDLLCSPRTGGVDKIRIDIATYRPNRHIGTDSVKSRPGQTIENYSQLATEFGYSGSFFAKCNSFLQNVPPSLKTDCPQKRPFVPKLLVYHAGDAWVRPRWVQYIHLFGSTERWKNFLFVNFRG